MLVALSRDSRWVGWTWPMWPCTGPDQEVMERDRQAGRVEFPGPGPRLRVLHSVRLASASLCSARSPDDGARRVVGLARRIHRPSLGSPWK
jgi:hypothetical protein